MQRSGEHGGVGGYRELISSHGSTNITSVSRITTDEKELKSRKDLYRRSPVR